MALDCFDCHVDTGTQSLTRGPGGAYDQAWEPEEPATAAPAEEAPVEQVDIAAEPADDDAEQRLAELAAAEDDSVIEREKPGVGTRFWNRVTNVWPLQEWFKYDGCEVRVRDRSVGVSLDPSVLANALFAAVVRGCCRQQEACTLAATARPRAGGCASWKT